MKDGMKDVSDDPKQYTERRTKFIVWCFRQLLVHIVTISLRSVLGDVGLQWAKIGKGKTSEARNVGPQLTAAEWRLDASRNTPKFKKIKNAYRNLEFKIQFSFPPYLIQNIFKHGIQEHISYVRMYLITL